jgi:hypothetical protein
MIYCCCSELLWPYMRARLDSSHTFINCTMTYIRIPDAFSYDTIQQIRIDYMYHRGETNASIYDESWARANPGHVIM